MAEGSVPLISSEVLANPVDEARLTLIAAEVLATAVSEARGSAIAAGGAAVSRGDGKCSNFAATRDHRHDCWSVIRRISQAHRQPHSTRRRLARTSFPARVAATFAERRSGPFVTMPHSARERSIMTNRLPPVSPASRSPKGPGNQAEPPTSMDRKRADQVPGRRQGEHNQPGLRAESLIMAKDSSPR
jgi:hypothetical protein